MNKVISLNKKVIVFLLLMYVLTLIGFMPSYAYYKTTVIKNGVVTLNTFINLDLTVTGTGVSGNSFTLPAGTSKTVNVEVTCDQDYEVSHKMWYKATGTGTFTVTSTNTFPNDIVASDFTKTITYTLTFQNTGTTDVSINLGVQSGFARNEITLEQGKEIKLGESNEILLQFIDQIETTPQEDTGIKFYNTSSSTNGQGLYMMSSTANDEYPIYYYRGNVNNNNIYFAENCWKIVRTTSTGGLKLIYNGEATDVDGKKQCLQTTGEGTQLPTTTTFNSSSSSPAYVGYSLPASSSIYTYSRSALSSGVYYGSSIDQTTYELVDPQTTLDNNHHYSYNSNDIHATGISGDTGNVRYYYYLYITTGSYIKFAKTKNIQTVLNEMLSEPVSKENPSEIQSYINTWWSNYDATYGDFLEDTEWCNDRSIAELNGWNPNGGDLTKTLFFTSRVRYDQYNYGSNPNNIKNTNQPILTCSNVNDKLTVSNGSLTYKIGLLTYDEVAMAGAVYYPTSNSNYYLYTNQEYWLLLPSSFINSSANGGRVISDGYLSGDSVSLSFGARPALSLKLGTTISMGDGTKENPYIVGE